MKGKKWLNLLLYSNIFVSLCAAAITAETYLLAHLEINFLYIFFVFSCTLVFYNFPSLFFAEDAFSANQSERHKWILGNRKFLIISFALSLISAFITSFFFPLKFILLLVPTSLLAFAYFFPQTHLRNITGLKTIIVAFVWTMIAVFYPLLLSSDLELANFLRKMSGILILQNFLFIFPLCVIYNVRDIESDKKAGVRTIPVVYGVKTTVIISLLSLVLFSSVVMLSPFLLEERTGLLLSAVPTGVLLWFASEKRADYYYSLWIDGMIILQTGLVFGIKFLNN